MIENTDIFIYYVHFICYNYLSEKIIIHNGSINQYIGLYLHFLFATCIFHLFSFSVFIFLWHISVIFQNPLSIPKMRNTQSIDLSLHRGTIFNLLIKTKHSSMYMYFFISTNTVKLIYTLHYHLHLNNNQLSPSRQYIQMQNSSVNLYDLLYCQRYFLPCYPLY